MDLTRGSSIIFGSATPCNNPAAPLPFTPSRSSPLCTQAQNTLRGIFNPKMLPSPPSSPDFLAPKRLFKPVPIFVPHEKVRETRRNLFLKKVRSGREDKIMKSRGGEDEMMRLIFVSEQKRWEATQARAAATISTIYEEEELEVEAAQDYELLYQTSNVEEEEEDFDKIIEREGEELEAMLSQLDLDFDHAVVADSVKGRDEVNLSLPSSITWTPANYNSGYGIPSVGGD